MILWYDSPTYGYNSSVLSEFSQLLHFLPPHPTFPCGSPGQWPPPFSIFTSLLTHFGFLDPSPHLASLILLPSFLPVLTSVWKNGTVISRSPHLSYGCCWSSLWKHYKFIVTSLSWAWSSSYTPLVRSPATIISYCLPTSLLISVSAAELDSCFKGRWKPKLPHVPPSSPQLSTCTPIYNSFPGN